MRPKIAKGTLSESDKRMEAWNLENKGARQTWGEQIQEPQRQKQRARKARGAAEAKQTEPRGRNHGQRRKQTSKLRMSALSHSRGPQQSLRRGDGELEPQNARANVYADFKLKHRGENSLQACKRMRDSKQKTANTWKHKTSWNKISFPRTKCLGIMKCILKMLKK